MLQCRSSAFASCTVRAAPVLLLLFLTSCQPPARAPAPPKTEAALTRSSLPSAKARKTRPPEVARPSCTFSFAVEDEIFDCACPLDNLFEFSKITNLGIYCSKGTIFLGTVASGSPLPITLARLEVKDDPKASPSSPGPDDPLTCRFTGTFALLEDEVCAENKILSVTRFSNRRHL